MNDAQNTANSDQPSRAPTGLWASAFVLFALILIQAEPIIAQQGLGKGAQAHAAQSGMVSQVGPITVLTADAGSDDVLLVLEGRSEELYVYRTDRNGIQLQQRMPVSKVFQDAKVMSGH
jgi:hypothetical protein